MYFHLLTNKDLIIINNIIIFTAGLSFYDFEPAKKLTTKVIFIEINKFTTPLMLQLEHTD